MVAELQERRSLITAILIAPSTQRRLAQPRRYGGSFNYREAAVGQLFIERRPRSILRSSEISVTPASNLRYSTLIQVKVL